MATSITFKNGNLTNNNISSVAISNHRTITFTKSPGTLIYCNSPERIRSEHLAESGKRLNRVTVTTDTAQVFASYINEVSGGDNVYLGIRITNPNPYDITVTKLNNGYNTGSTKTDEVQLGAYTSFFNNNPNTPYIIGEGDSVWLARDLLMNSTFFELLLRFSTTGTCIVTVYAYKNINNVNGNETQCGYVFSDNNMVNEYSGKGDTYFIQSNIELPSASLLNSLNNSYYYWLADCAANNTNEMVAIEMCQGGSAYCTASDARNLGNFGVQYYFNVTLKNTSPGRRVKFIGTMGSNADSSFPLLQSGSSTVGKWMQGAKSWEFYESETLNYGTSKTIEFQFMPGSQASAATFMQWKVVEV